MHNDTIMMVSLLSYAERLDARLARAQDRADHLAEVSNRYEEETFDSQDPEENAHLDRLIDLARYAEDVVERLQMRIEETKALYNSLDDQQGHRADRRRRAGRRRRERRAR